MRHLQQVSAFLLFQRSAFTRPLPLPPPYLQSTNFFPTIPHHTDPHTRIPKLTIIPSLYTAAMPIPPAPARTIPLHPLLSHFLLFSSFLTFPHFSIFLANSAKIAIVEHRKMRQCLTFFHLFARITLFIMPFV